MGIHSQQSFSLSFTTTTPPTYQSCLDEERAERDSERAARSVTARSCETTSRVSPSPPSAVSRAVVVSSVSLASSTRRPVVLKIFLENVIRDSVTYTEHAKRKTV